jgi:hypothetical protein
MCAARCAPLFSTCDSAMLRVCAMAARTHCPTASPAAAAAAPRARAQSTKSVMACAPTRRRARAAARARRQHGGERFTRHSLELRARNTVANRDARNQLGARARNLAAQHRVVLADERERTPRHIARHRLGQRASMRMLPRKPASQLLLLVLSARLATGASPAARRRRRADAPVAADVSVIFLVGRDGDEPRANTVLLRCCQVDASSGRAAQRAQARRAARSRGAQSRRRAGRQSRRVPRDSARRRRRLRAAGVACGSGDTAPP